MHGPDGFPIVFVEWCKHDDGVWRPIAAMTERSLYDFDWCEQDGELLYRDVGSPSSNAILAQVVNPNPIKCRVWSTIPLTNENADKLSRAEIRSRGYAVVKEIHDNPFDDANEGRSEWCQVCQSHFDEESTCRHIHQCYDGNGYSWGSGAADCDLEETRLSLYRMLRLMPPAAVRCLESIISAPDFNGSRHTDSILGGDCRVSFQVKGLHLWLYLEPLGREARYEQRYAPGLMWLYSLDSKTVRQNRLTAGWIWQFEHESFQIGAPEASLYYHCDRNMIEPFVQLEDITDLPDTKIAFDQSELDRNAHTVHFETNPHATESLVLRCEELKEWVEVSVADVARVDGTIWQFTPGRILRRGDTDIRTAVPDLIVQSYTKPEERKRARKTVKKS